jgi:sphingomyelin phosphodiesterase acid-like 3
MKNKFINALLVLVISITSLILPIDIVAETNKTQLNFLVLSDIHINATTKIRMTINPDKPSQKSPRINNLDIETFKEMLKNIQFGIQNGLIQNPSFILVTGDLAGHNRDNDSDVYKNQAVAFKFLHEFFPNKPILYIFGNNDSLEKPYGAFYIKNAPLGAHSPFEIAKNNGWKDGFLSTGNHCKWPNPSYPCLSSEEITSGYYSAYIQSKLKLIALNSIMLSDLKATSDDPSDNQLKWLNNELESARKNNEKILLVSHIPFGNDILDNTAFWRQKYQEALYKLLNAYNVDIIGILSGHTHMEELKIIKNSTENDTDIQAVKSTDIIIIAPGLSTSDGNAPGWKTFDLQKDNDGWHIANYKTFAFVPSDNNKLSIKKLYSFNRHSAPFYKKWEY